MAPGSKSSIVISKVGHDWLGVYFVYFIHIHMRLCKLGAVDPGFADDLFTFPNWVNALNWGRT